MLTATLILALLFQYALMPSGEQKARHWYGRWLSGVEKNRLIATAPGACVIWIFAVIAPALAVAAVYGLLRPAGWLLALAWGVFVLWLMLGARELSQNLGQIRQALEFGNDERARQALQDWQQCACGDAGRDGLCRRAICCAVLAAQRDICSVLFWYVAGMLAGFGPAGAVLCGCAAVVQRRWCGCRDVAVQPLARVAGKCWYVLNWLPARLMAATMAAAGHFEGAMEGWRSGADAHPGSNDALVLGAAGGALGLEDGLDPQEAPSSGAAMADRGPDARREVGLEHLRRATKLLWRTIVLQVGLLALAEIAGVF